MSNTRITKERKPGDPNSFVQKTEELKGVASGHGFLSLAQALIRGIILY